MIRRNEGVLLSGKCVLSAIKEVTLHMLTDFNLLHNAYGT